MESFVCYCLRLQTLPRKEDCNRTHEEKVLKLIYWFSFPNTFTNITVNSLFLEGNSIIETNSDQLKGALLCMPSEHSLRMRTDAPRAEWCLYFLHVLILQIGNISSRLRTYESLCHNCKTVCIFTLSLEQIGAKGRWGSPTPGAPCCTIT